MKFIKKISTALFLIGLFILLLISSYLLYEYNLRAYRIKVGIRPFSELLEMDFTDVENETIQNRSKCDSKKVLGKGNYAPEEYKLTILNNCWREYENDYVKFRFRDLNNSLKNVSNGRFSIKETVKSKQQVITNEGLVYPEWTGYRDFGVRIQSKNGDEYEKAILNHIQYLNEGEYIGTQIFVNPMNEIIYRTESEYVTVFPTINRMYSIDLPSHDYYIEIWGESLRAVKEILTTIELK
jgi:hypothetical protein